MDWPQLQLTGEVGGDYFYGNWGYIDKSGKYVIQPKFAQAGPFVNGLAVVVENIKSWNYGVIDKSGNYTIKPQFRYLNNFSENLAVAAAAEIGNSDILM